MSSNPFLSRAEAPETVVRYFRRAWERDRLAHAYLFTGPPDSGKRRFASLLAKALFCPTGEPCESCPSCRSVDNGNHPTVQVYRTPERKASMDIGAVRQLSRRDRFRHRELLVWIIEEAESLSAPASNALLKTLEEPSPGSLLILIAPSAGSLLPTLVSRCQRIQFHPVREPEDLDSAPAAGEAERQVVDALRASRFLAEQEPREWLAGQAPEGSSPRASVAWLIDRVIDDTRRDWQAWESGEPTVRGDPLRQLEDLVSLRKDLDANVNVDLVLEALIRRLRT